jgi:ABC-type oligopeptide transport system substrate-binding subunit
LPGWQFSARAVNPAALEQVARSSQLTLTAWRADLPDTLGFLVPRLRTGGAQNLGAVSLSDADALLDQAATISTSNGVARAEQLYITNVAWIPLAQGTFPQVMRAKVISLTYSADQHISLTTWRRAWVRV